MRCDDKTTLFPAIFCFTDRLDYYQLYVSRSLAFTISDKLNRDFLDQDFPVLTTGLSYYDLFLYQSISINDLFRPVSKSEYSPLPPYDYNSSKSIRNRTIQNLGYRSPLFRSTSFCFKWICFF